jgi:hypothetical protein
MPRKRQYHVVNASQNPVKEVDIDGHKITLDKQGQTYVHDTGLAEELDARYGWRAKTAEAGKVMVIPVDDSDPTREKGHIYTFTVPDMSRFKKKRTRK